MVDGLRAPKVVRCTLNPPKTPIVVTDVVLSKSGVDRLLDAAWRAHGTLALRDKPSAPSTGLNGQEFTEHED